MPKAIVEEQEQWKLPHQEPMPATLVSVVEKSFSGVSQKTGKEWSITKWTWEWDITGGDYAGLKAWGDTDPKMTNHPDDKVRQWAETLLGVELDMGDGIDTDDLLGLSGLILCNNTEEKKKDGTPFFKSEVVNVLPADYEPPF